MGKKPLFAKLRRKIADKILGQQTVLFTARRNIDLIEAGAYLELPTRRWRPLLGAGSTQSRKFMPRQRRRRGSLYPS
jgi:hypothetical protein